MEKTKMGTLFDAVRRGDLKRTLLLLDAGADVGVRNNAGWSPLDIACDLPEDNPRREEILSLFRDLAPEACFTKFCETPGGMPGR